MVHFNKMLEHLRKKFSAGAVRALWVPSRLNASDGMTNSMWYRQAVTKMNKKFVDMLEDLKHDNTFLTYSNSTRSFTPREYKSLEDKGFHDKGRHISKSRWRNIFTG